MQPLTHAGACVLLAERLDWELDPTREEMLERHLEGCPACRGIDLEYRRERAALRTLRAPDPPRDLWARTAAALDRESAHLRRPTIERTRGPAARPASPARPAPALPRIGGPRRRHLGLRPAFASLALVAIAAVVGSQLLPGGILAPYPHATPIALAPEPLAYIGVQGNQIVLVRSSLDHVCPPQAVDCSELPAGVSQVVALPDVVDLSALAVDPRGEHAAVAGQAGNQTTFYVINLPPLPSFATAIPSSPAPSGSSFGVGSAKPTGQSAGSTRSPSPAEASPTAPPRATITVTVAPSPRRSAGPTPRKTATPTALGSRTATPRPHEPSPRRSATPSSRTATATARPTAASTRPLPPASAGSEQTGATPTAPASAGATATVAPAVAQVILSDVVPTGLPAAWSPDGSTLAFSAMPADGSQGSDIYTWQPGDLLAVPVTDNHNSYFASWVGSMIVGSRAVPEAGDPLELQAQSFVIDPANGQERPLRMDNVWLPSVDPTGHFVAFWNGGLTGAGTLPALGSGELDFERWAALDPFAEAPGGATATRSPAPSAPATASHGSRARATATLKVGKTTATPRPTTSPRPTASPTATVTSMPRERVLVTGGSPTPSATATPTGPQPIFPPGSLSAPSGIPTGAAPSGASSSGSSAADSGSPSQITTATPPPTPTPTPNGTTLPGSAAGFTAIPPSGPLQSPVIAPGASGESLATQAPGGPLLPGASPGAALPSSGVTSVVIGDYAIAWASDGSALGVWRADTPGAVDGLLSVFSIDASTGTLVTGPLLLGPTPSQRYFAMGRDRIAYSSPPDLFGSSQLHVVAWGPFGRGELRRSVDQRRLLTAF